MSLFPSAPDGPSAPARPGSNWVHAHCDGGSRGNPGPSGYGAHITDASGQTLAELSEYLGIRTNNFAEYSGLLAVLDWALANGHRALKLVSDSELMVKQIQGKYKVNSPDLKPLWQQARDRIARLDRFEISHALRHKNKQADALANQAMDRGTGRGSGKTVAGGAAPPVVESLPLRSITRATAAPAPAALPQQTMLRGFTRDGAIHLLGGATLPDGVFVKVIPE